MNRNCYYLCIFIFQTSWLFAELIDLAKVNQHFRFNVYYATKNNFTHKKIYPSARCFLQKPVAHALSHVQKELEKQNLGLIIFDAYRPLRVQKIFWKICPNENFVADPAKGSRHNRGCAVDLSLIDLKTGTELVMPSGFDDFSTKATRNYAAMEPEACKNCKLLEKVMEKYGFKGLTSEWWHFDFVGIDYQPGKEAWKQFPVTDIDIQAIA